MSTAAPTVAVPPLAEHGRVTQLHVALSEWTKLHSLRSTRRSLFVAVLLTIGFPCLFASILSSRWGHLSAGERADHARHPLEVAIAGVNVSQLAIAVLGVLVITGEYSTGMIRSSFLAVPKRLPVLWAKTGVYALVVAALMVPSVLIGYFASQAILNRHHILQVSFSQHGVARAVLGAALYLVLVGVFALAVGAIVRNTAGGIATFAAIFFVIPPLLLLLPSSWRDPIEPYLPNNAAQAIATLSNDSHTLNPGPGAIVFLGYCALVIGIAAILLRRRDT
jgi:hypothetical protein